MNPDISIEEFIPFHLPSIGEEEIAEVVATLRSGWLTTGRRTHRFEELFRDYVGAPYALAVNSGTAAMHLALAALPIGPNDEVITTPLTFCATVNSILHVGATPVLADIGADGNICPKEIERKITPRTRALMPVHFAGLPCDMETLWHIARRHNLFVIEDAAHAVGSLYRGRPIGSSFGPGEASAAVAFSFYATKGITTGEGGMVTTGDQRLAESMRILALHGINKDAWNRYTADGSWFYDVVACGFKYNLSDLQSSLGIHQLAKIEDFVRTRARYAAIYNSYFEDIDEVEIPPNDLASRHSWHLYVLRLNLERLTIDRAAFISELKRARIGTSVHFIPIPLHRTYQSFGTISRSSCPAAIKWYERSVSLPIYPAMSEEQVDYVASTVRNLICQHTKKRRLPRPTGKRDTHNAK